MLIYIIVALSLLLFAVLSEIKYFRDKKIFKNIFLICGAAELFIVSGFRVNTGMDYPMYTIIFNRTVSNSLVLLAQERFEKGYVLLSRYIQIFTGNFRALFIVTSFIVVLLAAVIVWKYCKNPSLGLLSFYLLGFYFNSMNFIRTMLAASVILFAYKYIRDRQFLKFFALVLLASTFHFSALLMLPFYFILNIKINYKSLSLLGAIGGAVFLLSNDIMLFVTTYLYTMYSPETSRQMFSGIPSAYSLFILIILICAVLLRRDIKKHSQWGNVLISAAFFDFYFGFIGYKHSILSRFALYFGPIMSLLLVPLVIRLAISKIKNKTDTETKYKIRTYFCLIGTSAASVSFFIYALLNNYNQVVPHNWIWSLK